MNDLLSSLADQDNDREQMYNQNLTQKYVETKRYLETALKNDDILKVPGEYLEFEAGKYAYNKVKNALASSGIDADAILDDPIGAIARNIPKLGDLTKIKDQANDYLDDPDKMIKDVLPTTRGKGGLPDLDDKDEMDKWLFGDDVESGDQEYEPTGDRDIGNFSVNLDDYGVDGDVGDAVDGVTSGVSDAVDGAVSGVSDAVGSAVSGMADFTVPGGSLLGQLQQLKMPSTPKLSIQADDLVPEAVEKPSFLDRIKNFLSKGQRQETPETQAESIKTNENIEADKLNPVQEVEPQEYEEWRDSLAPNVAPKPVEINDYQGGFNSSKTTTVSSMVDEASLNSGIEDALSDELLGVL